MATTNLSLLTRLKSLVLSLPHKEASFSRREFPGVNSPSRTHLETILHAFVDGYNMSVVESDPKALVRRLNSSIPPEFVGFAYEGTGLYCALMDLLIPGSARLEECEPHDYIAMVGAGFAISRVPLALHRLESYQKRLDELTCFCLADGYGFHEGFFKWKSFVDGRKPAPALLNPQNRQLYDSGVARAMWWVYGADPVAIAAAISRFDEHRRPEMWAGLGVALSYASAGPGNPNPSEKLLELSGPYRYHLLSGIPFAAHMRWKGKNPAPWTERACSELLHMSVEETSDLVLNALKSFMSSWQGPAEDKWAHGYLAVREYLTRTLEERLSVRSVSTAAS
jgi:enediyne biosynthesis protein E3